METIRWGDDETEYYIIYEDEGESSINTFEQELRKLFSSGQIIDDPAYSGRSCFGTLGNDLRVRIQFISTHISDQYDALKLTVLNRTGGPVDSLVLKLKDLLGKKPVPNNPNFRDGVIPHLWDDSEKVGWYAYHPTATDYGTIRQAVEQYLSVFRDRSRERTMDGPRLVYICAPLRGEVEKNIEFARQKAQEVFQAGNIPVCPHLMFPPFADPDDPVQDQAAREMGLRLLEVCQQVNVYGPTWTEGMWAEIQHANKLGILVRIDQDTVEKSLGQGARGSHRHKGAAAKQKKEVGMAK